MPATLPEVRLAEAVSLVRRYRHHDNCRCGHYRRDGAAYCSEDEYRWQQAIDRLLDRLSGRETPH